MYGWAEVSAGTADTGSQDDPDFVGVTEESLTFLRTCVTGLLSSPTITFNAVQLPAWQDPWLNRIPWGIATRFNQGDGYFADHFGEPVPATAPGSAYQPVLTVAPADFPR